MTTSRTSRAARVELAVLLLAALVSIDAAGATRLAAQDSARVKRDTTRSQRLGQVTVTATRAPTDVFDAPAPMNVIDSAAIAQRQPNNAADLFREEPGLDVTGVGTNQTRPTIRGLRGQRILLLEDGLRLNNTRREQDFGELPAIVDVNDIDRVEVVRGPLSVLYGTDAIGGVVNLITDGIPSASTPAGPHGLIGYRYGSADDQRRPMGMLEQRMGDIGFRISGSYRETSSYDAPSGSFGDVTLPTTTKVNDTGIRDHNLSGIVGWDLSSSQRLFAKAESYHANNAGYGYVDPSVFGADQTLVQIRYPKQNVDRYTLGYRANALSSVFADRAEVTAYYMRNTRDLDQHIFAPFGPGTPDGAGVDILTHNFTDISSVGGRAEATKILFGQHVLTYGADFFRDHSINSDTSTTTVIGFGPPTPDGSGTPNVPDATFQSAGAFAQLNMRLADPLHVIVGGRAQDIRTATLQTPGLSAPAASSTENPLVGTASVIYRVVPQLNLIASVGRGFRSADLVERYFSGPTPEGSGYQIANANLQPETSLNVDVGARLQAGPLFAEAFVFRNDLRNGIAIAPTGDSINNMAVYQNVNVDRLRYTGGEGELGVTFWSTLTALGTYSHLSSKDVHDPGNPIGDTYSEKITGELSYRHPDGRFWLSYVVRHNGDQKDIAVGSTPVGPFIPAFTVHTVRAGVSLFEAYGMHHTLNVVLDNLTNELYAEFANASFFRPESGRNLILSYGVAF